MSRIACIVVIFLMLFAACAEATDLANVKSGLLLGVYASPHLGGMEVTALISGYSAEGRLFPGDVLMRVTTDGVNLHRLRSTYEMENAKITIGANQQAAMEIMRPGLGLIYAWVEFTPIASLTAAYSTQSKAMFRMESEKPGAREMFQSHASHLGRTAQLPKRGFTDLHEDLMVSPFVTSDNSDQTAANLFGRK